MLKPDSSIAVTTMAIPAAFGRLCVETDDLAQNYTLAAQPPSGGCVLKLSVIQSSDGILSSRLRAAVC